MSTTIRSTLAAGGELSLTRIPDREDLADALLARTAEVVNLAQNLLEVHDGILGWLSDEHEDLKEDLVELHDACKARRLAQEALLLADPTLTFEARVAETQRIMRDLATAPVTPIRATQEVPRG